MKDISKMKNYREKYKRYYNISFGKEYVVHHIDGNRENNNIDNLVLLPRRLHSKYHFQKAVFESQPAPLLISGNGLHNQSYYLSVMKDFFETLAECNKWFDFKMYLDGKIPNIHGIELRKGEENE